MMVQLIVVLIIVAVVFMAVNAIIKSNRRTGNKHSYRAGRGSFGRTNAFAPWPNENPPSALGVPYGHPARTAAERLEASLSESFESRVKDRVLKEFPRISDKEWDWTWFELKRYFLMCSIMRSVPMYSRQVDAVWHEMLMFTREYEQFCLSFCGEMIHHAPHAPGSHPEEGERALFDWLYGELFKQTPASGRIWGAFYRTRMSAQKLSELAEFSGETLRLQWFNTKTSAHYTDLNATVEYLITRSKSQRNPDKSRDSRSNGYDPVLGGTGMLTGMLIYYSISDPDGFIQQMNQVQNEEQRKANGSGDSTYVCSGSSDDGSDHSGDGSGGDSSCSSGGDSGGSSCGGGCSS
ncbi:hypothetical protein MHI37_29265 [Paenibacillus sp. FSL H8-0548]|uniref:hypothetical protein n=1 Tax=Paenibacillus sp. FSL H8-0548 TaxID=1920422 RepID=UPI0011804038|nr:hypothetical protein [Paenibacillus sp. FSL H8-0548]